MVQRYTILARLFCGFVIFVLTLAPVRAQQWKRLEQAPLGVQYEIPREWYVAGVLDARACHCAGGTLNTSYKGNVNMVVFVSDEYELDSLLRQSVWGYHYVDAPTIQTLATEAYQFAQSVSRWREDGSLQVIRLHTVRGSKRLVLYFWGDGQELERQNGVIERIVRSFSPLQ